MIAHIAIVARDYDEAIGFYTRALGFKLLRVSAMPFNLRPRTRLFGRNTLPQSRRSRGQLGVNSTHSWYRHGRPNRTINLSTL
jgi:catechol 2,3-dioxygenase-like lactoylglutathione lyase family enzyme